MHVYKYKYMYIYIHIYIHIYIYRRLTYLNSCMYASKHACIYVCIEIPSLLHVGRFAGCMHRLVVSRSESALLQTCSGTYM